MLIDGARPDVMQELLASGTLPHIEREIVRQGTFRVASSCAPSTTGPAYLPFLTGCFPGTINIPGIRWLDKAQFQAKPLGLSRMRSYNGIEGPLLNRDLSPSCKTLFEIFERPFNIFSMITRGLPKGHNLTRLSKPFAYTYAHLTDQWGFVDRIAARRLVYALDQNPDFIFAVFPNVDSFSHLFHPFHDKTIAAYRFIDRTVGKVTSALKTTGRWDDTLLILTSDHGLTATHHHLDLAMHFERRKISTLVYPIVWKRNPRVSVMISGNAMGQVYCLDIPSEEVCNEHLIRKVLGAAWDDLFEQEALDFVIWRENRAQYIIQNSRGRAHIAKHEAGLSYVPVTADPLGYGSISEPLTRGEALAATFDSRYPDALVQIDQLFAAPRCGDFVVISKNDYDLRRTYEWPEHHASHGSLCREHMRVPLVYNQCGWDERPARTADVFSTVLDWTGRQSVGKTDGASLLHQRRAP